MDIRLLDAVSAIIVIISLIYIRKDHKGWLLYSLGCFTYIYINSVKDLTGQAFLNIIAFIIAIFNYVKLRKQKTNSA